MMRTYRCLKLASETSCGVIKDLSDPSCCEHCSGDCQCFWMGRKNSPQNCPFPWDMVHWAHV